MPVQLFVGRGPEGKPLPPDYSHEMRTTIQLIRQLWTVFHPFPPYYAVATNLDEPSADILVISERGVGVLELKHYFGRVTCRTDGSWYAGPKKIQSGVPGRGFINPHEQVQFYAEQIRKKLIEPPPYQKPWLPGKTIDWGDFKFQTAVCFTHPDADLLDFHDQLRKRCRPINLPWEDFSLLDLNAVSRWAASLRFEVNEGKSTGYARLLFKPEQISRILNEVFNLTTWDELVALMPAVQPYAVLTRYVGDMAVQDFALEKDEIIIGRDINACDFPVPDNYSLVSRTHARIQRSVDGIFIEDLGSTNGTFLDGVLVERRTRIVEGQRITLGKEVDGSAVGIFVISFKFEPQENLDATQQLGEIDLSGNGS